MDESNGGKMVSSVGRGRPNLSNLGADDDDVYDDDDDDDSPELEDDDDDGCT